MRNYAREFFWGAPPEDPAERKLVLKLDSVILSYCCLAYFTNYLDRANLANAYVSGMREDVNFQGNDYTYANSCFTAGYVVGQIPSALVLASGRIPPRYWFPFCCFSWGILTLGLAFVHSPGQVMAIRFIQAIFEASTFSGTHYILGSWFKEAELGKRSAVFATCAQIGSLFSGLMQGAIIQTLEGRNGLRGWQWLFIIDFIITFPIAIYGVIMFPDTPATTTAFWLTESEKELALTRLPPVPHVKMTWSSLASTCKKCVTDWRWYLFSALWMLSATAFEKVGVYSEFLLWLKTLSPSIYTAAQVNYYPSIFVAVAILSTYLLTLFSDMTRNRFIINVIMFTAMTISCIIVLIWDVSLAAHWFSYIIGGLGYAGQASNFAWANTLCADDDAMRSFTLFSMNLFSNLWNLWYQIVAWPVTDAPRFRNGQIASLVTGAASVAIAVGIVYLTKIRPPTHLQDGHEKPPLRELEEEHSDHYGHGGGEKDLVKDAGAGVAIGRVQAV